jgi:cytochrome c oxidase assembly factor CtaG
MDNVTAFVPPDGPLTAWRFDPVTVGALLGAASAYAVAVARVRRKGGSVPAGRVTAWYGGIAVTALALVSPVDAYADVSFLTHMTQHLVLTFVAPPLLALGAPLTLALRATPPATARRIAAALGGRTIAALARPVVGWMLLVGASWAVHYSPLFDAALTSATWHAVEHTIWMAAAFVYWWPIVGADPAPHPVAFHARLLSLVLAMPAMSFLALSIFVSGAPLYPAYASRPAPWGPAALDAQRSAAVLMWLAGNLGLVVAMLVVAAVWKRHDDERQRREEARLDAAAAST